MWSELSIGAAPIAGCRHDEPGDSVGKVELLPAQVAQSVEQRTRNA